MSNYVLSSNKGYIKTDIQDKDKYCNFTYNKQ